VPSADDSAADASPDAVGEAVTLDRAAHLLFARPTRFVTSAADPEDLPASDLPEVAVVGRSNVGKSSLINALTGQSGLAKTSGTPGRTRLLNLFLLDDRLHLVDLPGYGYARASKVDIARWQAAMRAYLRGRQPLRRVLLLVDARRGWAKLDEEMAAMLDEAAVNYQGVLTKADKLKAGALKAARSDVEAALRAHPAAHPEVLTTSAEKGWGLDPLRSHVAKLSL
jgi:GTP-binding protein